MEMFAKIAGIVVVVVGAVVLFLSVVAGISAVFGVIVMLIFGFLHGSVSESIPAYGFFVSWGISMVISFILALAKKIT